MLVSNSVFILFLATHIPYCHGTVNNEDVQNLSLFCFPENSCKLNNAATCKCDHHCALYGDCCIDSPYRSIRTNKSAFVCRKQRKYGFSSVYVKSVCPRYNVDNWVRQKCQGYPSSNDIELQVPVFSSHSSITYKNYYCALCNNDLHDLIFWDVALSCDIHADPKTVKENLIYNDRKEKWGFWDFSKGGNNWVSCSLYPQLSPRITDYRECSNTVISECYSQWSNNVFRSLCSSYESRLVSTNGNVYKNLHCALCNNLNIDDLKCQTRVLEHEHKLTIYSDYPGVYSSSPRGILTINFRDLIDINLNKGNKIEKLKTCPDGQVYDEAFGRCAEVFCIGNRVPRGGKCVVA